VTQGSGGRAREGANSLNNSMTKITKKSIIILSISVLAIFLFSIVQAFTQQLEVPQVESIYLTNQEGFVLPKTLEVTDDSVEVHVAWNVSCVPDCANKQCGPDGCETGGVCAPGCTGGDVCDANGQCAVMDYDGNVYSIVEIGNQTWMAENLKVARTPGGDSIVRRCYGSNENNCGVYGGLYTWDVAMTICPSGWHLPTDIEWATLVSNAGSNAGDRLKKEELCSGVAFCGTSGFDALASGSWYHDINYAVQRYENLDKYTGFWTSTHENMTEAYYYRLKFETTGTIHSMQVKRYSNTVTNNVNGKSVRCIKD